MKATVCWLGALVVAAVAASCAQAQPYFPGAPQAPDACGPGYYNRGPGPCGAVYGPNYWVYPCCPPFNGLLPSLKPCPEKNCGPVPGFPTHPYARGPRDYFMLER